MASLNEITGTLGRTRAAHLLRRATFGPTISEIDQFAGLTATAALNLLLDDTAADPLPPIDTATGSTWVDPAGTAFAVEDVNSEQDDLFAFFQAWHMDVMRQAPLTLKERISWFFHTHLPARWTEINSSEAIYYQNGLFRHYAYGSFKDLFKKICVDNAMLRYLDGYSNKKNSPNENFAREMFELYGIGKGPQVAEGDYTHYTEDDIKAATRVLTGWELDETFANLDADTGLPAGKMRSHLADGDGTTELATEHDEGQKTFSSKFGDTVIAPATLMEGYATVEAAYQELDDMIEMMFAQAETARFIARKLYRFFVYHFISAEVETDIIAPLAQELIDNDFVLTNALSLLLKSEHFFDADDAVNENDNMGALIKSPVDVFTGLFRLFAIQFPDRETETTIFYQDMDYLVSKLVDQGLNFYEPFEVAGYPAYHQIPAYNRNWITTYALAHRYQSAGILMQTLEQSSTRTFVLDIVGWVENSGSITDPSDAAELMDVLVAHLFPLAPTQERYDYFLYTVFLDYTGTDHTYARGLWTAEWNAYIGSGDDTVVRGLLGLLLSSLIETPEFQLY